MAQQVSAKKQQGESKASRSPSALLQPSFIPDRGLLINVELTELQLQYSTYKNNLQQIAQKIGDVEQETEEHK